MLLEVLHLANLVVILVPPHQLGLGSPAARTTHWVGWLSSSWQGLSAGKSSMQPRLSSMPAAGTHPTSGLAVNNDMVLCTSLAGPSRAHGVVRAGRG